MSTGKPRRQLYNKRNGHSEWVTCVQHLADGRIASGGMDSKICLWNKSGTTCAYSQTYFCVSSMIFSSSLSFPL